MKVSMNKITIFFFLSPFLTHFSGTLSNTQTPHITNQPPDQQLHIIQSVSTTNPPRLHLGSGVWYLKGYVNIDLPATQHTVQTNTTVDIYANLLQVKLPPLCLQEIRSHHLFEHFDRPTALALLGNWHQWLLMDGTLVIETPDFAESIKLFSSPAVPYGIKQRIIRHIFGSHEASWAIHYDGWYEEKYRHILEGLGFEITRIEHTQWQNLANIIVYAQKKRHLTREEIISKVQLILWESLVPSELMVIPPSEVQMWRVWIKKFSETF